jgi:glycosyltransferase involved in cell wall biosynthesis
MERDAGVPGRLLGYGVLEGRVPPLWEMRPEEFPLAGEILDRATALVVHSHYVEARAREAGFDGTVWVVPHPAWPVPSVRGADVGGEPLFGCFGFLNESKRIPQLLEAFALLRRERPGARLLLVGAAGERFDVERRLERLGIVDGVDRIDYVPEGRMWSLMAACDVLVNLRYPTMGETSGSVIRGLSLGKPLVVSDVGWFGELPDDVVLKVPVDEVEVDVLRAALEVAAEHGATLGANARAYVEHEHSLAGTADGYVRALELSAGGATVDDAVIRRVAEAAAEIGIDDVSVLAARLREVGFGA